MLHYTPFAYSDRVDTEGGAPVDSKESAVKLNKTCTTPESRLNAVSGLHPPKSSLTIIRRRTILPRYMSIELLASSVPAI